MHATAIENTAVSEAEVHGNCDALATQAIINSIRALQLSMKWGQP